MFRSSLGFLTLAFAALLAGCSADTNDEFGASDAPLTAASCGSAPSSHEVLVDLASLAGLECRPMEGSFAVLTWEGREYYDYVSDDPAECGAQRDAMRAASWTHHGLRGIELTRC